MKNNDELVKSYLEVINPKKKNERPLVNESFFGIVGGIFVGYLAMKVLIKIIGFMLQRRYEEAEDTMEDFLKKHGNKGFQLLKQEMIKNIEEYEAAHKDDLPKEDAADEYGEEGKEGEVPEEQL